MSKNQILIVIIIGLFILSGTRVDAAPGDTTADAVLGQGNFTSNLANGGGATSATGIEWPYGLAVNPGSGRLFMADFQNNRVLSWPNAESFANGAAADLVLGQMNFTSSSANQGGSPNATNLHGPVGVAFDAHTNRLYVSDYFNHRVLSYAAPFSNGMAADIVYGQPGFNSNTANNGGISKDSLNFPWGVSVDNHGRLAVADYGNNRVLLYLPVTGLRSALTVYGQSNFISGAPNNGGISAQTLSGPTGVFIRPDNEAIYVADTNNNRVLAYGVLSGGSGMNAFLVLGQSGSFTSGAVNSGGLGPKSMSNPTDITFDDGQNLYVADRNNNRILRFDVLATIDDTADQVYGQPNFTTNTANTGGVSADSLYGPYGLTVTPGLGLLVSDRTNNRVLRYDMPRPNPVPELDSVSPSQVAVGSPSFDLLVLGSGFTAESQVTWNGSVRPTTFVHQGELLATISASDVNQPFLVNVGVTNPAPGGGSSGLQSVTGYTPMAQDSTADRVLGQPEFTSIDGYNPQLGGFGPRSFYEPRVVEVDPSSGRIYVGDTPGQRVLSWPSAANFVNGDPADMVLGQPDFYSKYEPTVVSAATLGFPLGIAIDGDGNVFVSDFLHHRVLGYFDPASTDQVADVVFGQPDFISSTLNNGGLSASSLNSPTNLTVDSSGNLYVSDRDNARILVYFDPLTSDRVADIVIGQPNFTTGGPTGSPLPINVDLPAGLAVDSNGRLYAVDVNFNRVMVFDTPLANGEAATFVLGQPDLYSGAANNGGLNASSLFSPQEIALDSQNNVYIADLNNNRVLGYLTPLDSNDKAADIVFGQPNFTSGAANQGGSPTANSLDWPTGVAIGPGGDLFVSDQNNNRMLAYDSPLNSGFQVFLPAVLK